MVYPWQDSKKFIQGKIQYSTVFYMKSEKEESSRVLSGKDNNVIGYVITIL
jgi:hypothetical protein